MKFHIIIITLEKKLFCQHFENCYKIPQYEMLRNILGKELYWTSEMNAFVIGEVGFKALA
jgi:hypothetical protein